MDNLAILKGTINVDLIIDETLSQLFKKSAERFSTKPALIFGEKKITYQELDAWSDAVAVNLMNQNITVGSCVGLWYPRSIELHIAILAITKAGATYVPLDFEMPYERVETVLLESNAVACFTPNKLHFNCTQLNVDPFTNNNIQLPEINCKPNNYAYILYTSGSTGKPKGIPITQRQICHLIRAENSVLEIDSNDIVYQGFSVSFDMWCEETWISYFAGATLYVADATMAKAIDELSDVIRSNKITVLHAVPSLLAIMEDDLPSLRIINAGGEACSEQVLNKWSNGTRVFYNSYGPTETTVTSSLAPLKPNDKISIGKPLPNYNYAIVDEKLNILPFGELGELIITGVGVGDGYINLPELTSQKFVTKPLHLDQLPGDKIYKTGDEAIINKDGSVEFHGRIDDQIKIRGYRIELGEIENQMAACNGILAAAVTIKKDSFNQEQLVGYVLCKSDVLFNEQNIRTHLLQVLAPYMVPQIIMPLDEMPRLPSGKINKKQLPLPASFVQTNSEKINFNFNEKTSVEEKVVAILDKIFPGKSITTSNDFFTDLGGHSLLAASFVSIVRKEAGLKNVSLKDIYIHRPLHNLIQAWDKNTSSNKSAENTFAPVPFWRHTACWIAQTISLIFIYGLFASQIYLPYLGYYYTQTETDSHLYGLLVSLGLFCIVPPTLSMLSIASKWLLIGKYKEGEYPLWGWYYFRWWFVEKLEGLVQVNFLNGTPLYASYLRFRGLKIGADAQIGAANISAEDLIEIGDDVSISSNVHFDNVSVANGKIIFSKIKIGNHAYIGSSSVIEGNTEIKDWGELKDLSCLNSGSCIDVGEVWQGSPSTYVQTKSIDELPQPLVFSNLRKRYYYVKFSLMLLVFPFALLLPLLPILRIITALDDSTPDYDFSYLIYIPFLALLYMLLFALQTVILSRVLQYKIKPGVYSIYSLTYFRKWLADQLHSLSLLVMHPVFATVYVSTFFRALGAKIGAFTEISTANNVTHPMLEIGKNSFIADNVVLGESDVRGQRLILEKTIIGNNSFVGNSALIPQGYSLGNDMLIGVLSVPPSEQQLADNNAKDWFGSPAIALPKRQDSGSFDNALTFRPTKIRWLARAIIELIRIIMPETVLLCTSILFIAYVHDLLVDDTWWQFLFYFPLYFLGFIGLPCFLITVLLKWIFIQKYKEEQLPMWSLRVWLSEAVTTIYEALAIPFFLDFLRGTPWLPIFMRLFGTKIGKRVWMDTTDITEFDMVSIDDDAALNIDCGPQTHLFEDRVMKIGSISIGKQSSIGSTSIILYDSKIGNNVNVGSLSLLMKGEKLDDNTNWQGNPLLNH